MLRSAAQSKTQGSGICSVCERSRATASMSSNVRADPADLAVDAAPRPLRSASAASATASATSLGSENHCGADQPNWCA